MEAERLALQAIAQAKVAAATSGTDADRDEATKLINNALEALDDAVELAQAAATAARTGSAAAIGAAELARSRANMLLEEQTRALNNARDSYAWYGRNLVRHTIASSDVAIPRANTNVAKIVRIDRTKDINGDGAQQPNPDAFTSTTFKDIMYADGKNVFSISDDDEGGDEFKVDGYVNFGGSSYTLDSTINTGLKLTEDGLVIRTGGTGDTGGSVLYRADFTDMRKRILRFANDPDGDGTANTNPLGQNGWDLEITFDKPQFRSVANGDTSWAGNGDFYWKSVVRPHRSQWHEDGVYYDSSAFSQPTGYEELGTYQVWLSNHVGENKFLEPAPGTVATCRDGSRGTSCPDDDVNYYLEYAAYGLFVVTPDLETFFESAYNGRTGRINTIYFGYSAFAAADGQKTTDIGTAITGGKFHGYALAYETQGSRRTTINNQLLRGDVTLTVNIPKESGAGTLEGTMNNFQRWNDEGNYWAAYADNFKITLNSANISENGTFNGTLQAAPATGTGAAFDDSGAGVFKGSFYGPRSNPNNLEIAGSWSVGEGDDTATNKDWYGSFGAKQRPAATPASN